MNLSTREQREANDLVGARAWFGMATIDGRILAFGGMSPLKDSYDDIMEFNLETEKWEVTDDTFGSGFGISSFASALVEQNQICEAL